MTERDMLKERDSLTLIEYRCVCILCTLNPDQKAKNRGSAEVVVVKNASQ